MSPGPEDLLSQREKRAVLENDRRVREQRASTYHQFTVDEADTPRGRYSAQERSMVVGSTSAPVYPAGPAWCADPTGTEPALGYAVNDAPVVGEPYEVEQSIRQLGETGFPSGAPDGGAVEAPTSSSPCIDAVETAAPPTSVMNSRRLTGWPLKQRVLPYHAVGRIVHHGKF